MAETVDQWAARQPDLTNIADAMERKNALESWQKERPGYVDPTDYKTYEDYAGAAGIQSGKDAGNDLQNRANFYGMTIENYQNALSGDQTKPMGQYQQVYGNQLLSPVEQIAAQTARAQGIGEPNAYAMELAKKNPDVFNTASQKYQNYFANTYPGTLEYQSVLSGPMQFSNAGVKYPEIKDTASMYTLDPRTNQLVKNPNYKSPIRKADGGLMSLAGHMADKGRGPDSMLVHMAPQEVAGLQALAMKHGGTLTINPETGLPEAGFLSKILPMLAGAALNYFAPGFGTAISGALGLGEVAGAAAIGTGIGVGGATALATGSLSRGLMAGLGAYGGAGLQAGLAGAGSDAFAREALSVEGALPSLENATTVTGEGYGGSVANYQDQVNSAVKAARDTASGMPTSELMSAGAKAAGADPMGFAKQNWMPTMAAALPVLSAIGTTTPMTAKPTDTGYIRQKLYDPYTQTYKTLAPVKANEWGNRSFSDAYTNPQTGEISTLQPRAPGMASGGMTGGIVALAIGGDTKAALEQAYAANDVNKINEIAAQNKITAEDVGSTWSGFDTSGIKGLQLYAPPAAQVPPAYTSYTPEQIGQWFADNKGATNEQVQTAIRDTKVDPNAVNQYIASLDNPFRGSTETERGSGTLGIYNQMKAQGIDPNELYAASLATDPKYAGWTKDMIQQGYNLDKGMYALSDAKKGNVSDTDWAKLMVGNGTWDKPQYDPNAMAQASGLSIGEVRARFELEKLKAKTTTPATPITSVVPGGTKLPNATVYDNGAYGNYGSGPATGVDYLGRTVSTATPGDIITNPDGTRTVTPNIPGRPYGGFTGMDQVKSAYTAGGGSLGYTPQAPRTMAEFNQMYNKQTGDSMAAYNYLMGQGAYPTQSAAANSATGIQRPYWSSGVKYKPKFLTQNADGTISSSDAKAGTASLTAAKTINVANSQGQVEVATLGSDGAYHAPSGGTYDVSGKPINYASSESSSGTGGNANGGLMGYSVGGGLGSLGGYSDGGRLLKGPGDGVSDSIPATIGNKQQPARLADGEFVVPARIVSELGNGSTEAGAKKLYAMMDRVQKARGKTTGKNKVAANSRADKYLPA